MKLYYFDGPGKAESIRLLLTHANAKFEDVRYTFEDWPANRDKFELKQIPVLEDNGKKYCQSVAILEYLGKKYGYLPEDLTGHYEVMKTVATTEDLLTLLYATEGALTPFDEKAKAELRDMLFKKDGPKLLKALEDTLCKNKERNFIIGNKYTIADFLLLGGYRNVQVFDSWKKAFFGKLVEKAPNLYHYLETRMKDFNEYYKVCKHKLYYFESAGRAEMIRTALKHLKIDFEDVRYKAAEWPAIKAAGKFELNQLPAFECEPCGLKLCQSDAIMQWLGKKYGLLPEEPEKLYEVLWWCNSIKEVMETCWWNYLPMAEEGKKEMRKRLCEKTATNFFHAMEAKIRPGESLVEGGTTIAEFYLIGMYRACILSEDFKDVREVLEKYPKLKEYVEQKHKEY